MTSTERARAVERAVRATNRARGKGAYSVRDGRRLVLDDPPRLIAGRDGAPVGLEVRVRLFEADGTEVPIDPVRRIVNPPTVSRGREAPLAAFWEALWDSVTRYPVPEGWGR